MAEEEENEEETWEDILEKKESAEKITEPPQSFWSHNLHVQKRHNVESSNWKRINLWRN